jgi:hypothetical protein
MMKKVILSLGLDYKKVIQEIYVQLLIAGACTSISFVYLSIPISIMIMFSGVSVTYYVIQSRYQQKLKQYKEHRKQAFMNSFAMIKILLDQGMTAYQAVKVMMTYIPSELIDPLSTFILEVEKDLTIQPYLMLAQYFEDPTLEQLMVSLYQLEHHGGQYALHHFQYVFDQSDELMYQVKKQHIKDMLQGNLSYVMIATGVISFSLLAGILSMIGGMISGI